MKRTIKIIFLSGIIFLLNLSCEYTDLDLLDNPNEAGLEILEIEFLYNNIQLGFKDFFEESWVLSPLSRMGHISAFSYGEAFPATAGDALWTTAYSGILPDIEVLENLERNNSNTYYVGSSKILKAYVLFSLVDIFGNVPLSEGFQGYEEPSPQEDAGISIYNFALELLDEAILLLTDDKIEIPDNDLYYEGNRENWIALANTLKIRAYLNIRSVDGQALAKIEEIQNSENIIDDESEDFEFTYSPNRENPNSRHPFYNAAYESSPPPYLSNYYMWLFTLRVYDPRTSYYFNRQAVPKSSIPTDAYACFYNEGTPKEEYYPEHFLQIDPDLPYCIANENGLYGRDHLNGSGIPPDEIYRSVYGMYPAGGKFDNIYNYSVQNGGIDGFPELGLAPILQSSYTHYMLAEANLYLGNNDKARELMERGFRQSWKKVLAYRSFFDPRSPINPGPWTGIPIQTRELWEIEDTNAITYISRTDRAFRNAFSKQDKLDVLSREILKALWGNALDAYNLYRRTGKPKNMQPALLVDPGNFPRTLLYPSVHVNRNKNVSQKTFSTPVFWDTNDGNIFQR